MDFADLIAPLGEQQFLSDYWNKRPVHLPAPAESDRGAIIDWARLNALLAIRGHWTEPHIKLVMNSRPVAPDFYMVEVARTDGSTQRLADPARVETFLAMGASLVADQVEEAAPEIAALTSALARRFAARTGANLYASFRDVQAFASHCDLHEVFAIHCAGAKRWRVYANRAENPLESLTGDDAQQQIDRAKGPVLLDVTLRAGDVLYIPRGYFHDAIALDAASLHLTIGLAPASGRAIFRLLEETAIADPAFRAYLADARVEHGATLRAQVGDLAKRLADLMATPVFLEQLQLLQARLADPHHALTLPDRPALAFYARTERAAAVENHPGGTVLRSAAGETAVGVFGEVARYLLERPAVSLQELLARYPHHERARIEQLVAACERLGLIQRYVPET